MISHWWPNWPQCEYLRRRGWHALPFRAVKILYQLSTESRQGRDEQLARKAFHSSAGQDVLVILIQKLTQVKKRDEEWRAVRLCCTPVSWAVGSYALSLLLWAHWAQRAPTLTSPQPLMCAQQRLRNHWGSVTLSLEPHTLSLLALHSWGLPLQLLAGGLGRLLSQPRPWWHLLHSSHSSDTVWKGDRRTILLPDNKFHSLGGRSSPACLSL